MGDARKFKEKYKGTWDISRRKENRVIRLIEDNTRFTVKRIGFGSGSTEYIDGSGKENGHDTAVADLQLIDVDANGNPRETITQIEVSGPLRVMSENLPLWINKSKVRYALAHPEIRYIFAHVNGTTGRMRFIHIGLQFQHRVRNAELRSNPFENGMWEVEPTDFCVMNQETFIRWIDNFGGLGFVETLK